MIQYRSLNLQTRHPTVLVSPTFTSSNPLHNRRYSVMKHHEMVSSLKAIHAITALLRDHTPDDPAVTSILKSNRNLFEQMKGRLLGKPFIVIPSQMDVTQPEDFDYGTPQWLARWKLLAHNNRRKKANVGTKLSHGYNLSSRCLVKHVLASKRNLFGMYPEFAITGRRRCCFVRCNGMRCRAYWDGPVCRYHIRLVESVPRMNDRFLSVIKSEPLKEAYRKHLIDPDRKSIDSEIALMRTMLDVLLHRAGNGLDLQNLPLELVSQITIMCKTISETVERMANMEAKLGMRLTLDQVTTLVMNVVDLVIKTVPNLEQAQLTALADGIENMTIIKTVPTKETKDLSLHYGEDTTSTLKNSNPQDFYVDDGTVKQRHFTEDEVNAHDAMINAKFLPAQKEYYRKKELLEQSAKDWNVSASDSNEATNQPTQSQSPVTPTQEPKSE